MKYIKNKKVKGCTFLCSLRVPPYPQDLGVWVSSLFTEKILVTEELKKFFLISHENFNWKKKWYFCMLCSLMFSYIKFIIVFYPFSFSSTGVRFFFPNICETQKDCPRERVKRSFFSRFTYLLVKHRENR